MGTIDDMTEPRKETSGVIRGEFFTDGKTFIFQLAGTPLSGSGDSPQAAFDDLLRTEAASGSLGDRLKDLARDQAGERTRATVVAWSMAALIAFGVLGAAMVGALALVPMAVAGVAETTGKELAKQAAAASPPAAPVAKPQN